MRTALFSLVLVAAASPAIAADAPRPARPPACDADPKYKQFDFWLGSWEVVQDKPGSPKSADVEVERVLGGCGLRETWKAARGPTGDGIGLATYSRLADTWRYFWISGAGANSDFSVGQLVGDRSMQFTMEQPDPAGGKRLRHWTMTLLPDGRISEVAVGSPDAGKTWTTEYTLYWTKK